MSLELDERRRAMLGEMGVTVWQPLERREPVEAAPTARRPAPASAAAVSAPAAAALAGRPAAVPQPAEIESLDWEALAAAVAQGRAGPAFGRRPTMFGSGDLQPDWLVVGEAPDEHEERAGEPFAGPPGQLLDNMLKALKLDRRRRVYLTNIVKCRLPGDRNPEPQELADSEPILRRQVQLLQPRIILVMGRFAVPLLLGTSEPIGRLRGRAHQYLGVPVIATYHPAYLLRNPHDKARAWADLCLAAELTGQLEPRAR